MKKRVYSCEGVNPFRAPKPLPTPTSRSPTAKHAREDLRCTTLLAIPPNYSFPTKKRRPQSSSLDEMDTSSGGGGAFEAKGWAPPEEEEEQDRQFFENGEYLPSRIDTTQNSYYVSVSFF